MNTERISKVTYIDAYYGYAKKVPQTKLSVHEAYGYAKRRDKNIIITFIQKRTTDEDAPAGELCPIVKGLVIPDTAVVSISKSFSLAMLAHIPDGSRVSLVWRDVVYVANTPTYECSVMRTEGVLFRKESDHVVIMNPETMRITPLPTRHHPTEKPAYYVIPLSFINDIGLAK